MSRVIFDIPQTLVPIVGKKVKELFPVRRIYCIGQNYVRCGKHTGCMTTQALPYFFTKPSDSVVTDVNRFDMDTAVNLCIHYPPMTESFQYEVELVVAIGRHQSEYSMTEYSNLSPEEAAEVVFGYGVGVSLTRRDLQLLLSSSGHSLDLAKGPDEGAVVSPLVPAENLKEMHPKLFRNSERSPGIMCNGQLTLSVNGAVRQNDSISSMILPVDDGISRLSKYVTLKPGDLIYTGTPSGIGPVRRGDVLDCSVEGIGHLMVTVEK